MGGDNGSSYLSQGYQSKSELNSTTGVWTHYDVAVQLVSHQTTETPPKYTGHWTSIPRTI